MSPYRAEKTRRVAICHDSRGGVLRLLDLEAAVVEAEAVRTATQEPRKDLLLAANWEWMGIHGNGMGSLEPEKILNKKNGENSDSDSATEN